MRTYTHNHVVWSWMVFLPLFIGLAIGISLATVTPANAYSFDRNKVVAYAKKYACNLKESCRNSNYPNFKDHDCANFVSQALRAGGMPNNDEGSNSWYYKSKSDQGRAWYNVPIFSFYMVSGKGRADYRSVSMGKAYTPAKKGDVYMYDWGKGNAWSHLSVETGWGDYVDFYDPTAKKRYNQITGGEGDKIAQHSTDRDGAPWNWGYQTERKADVKKKMRTILIQFDP